MEMHKKNSSRPIPSRFLEARKRDADGSTEPFGAQNGAVFNAGVYKKYGFQAVRSWPGSGASFSAQSCVGQAGKLREGLRTGERLPLQLVMPGHVGFLEISAEGFVYMDPSLKAPKVYKSQGELEGALSMMAFQRGNTGGFELVETHVDTENSQLAKLNLMENI